MAQRGSQPPGWAGRSAGNRRPLSPSGASLRRGRPLTCTQHEASPSSTQASWSTWPKSRRFHATDRSPRCRPAPGPPAARPSETPTRNRAFRPCGPPARDRRPPEKRVVRVLRAEGRKGFGEDAVHDLAGTSRSVNLRTERRFAINSFELHNLLFLRTLIAGKEPLFQTDCAPDRHESDRRRGRFALFFAKIRKKSYLWCRGRCGPFICRKVLPNRMPYGFAAV